MQSFELENRSGYDSSDLRRFLARGFRASGIPASRMRRLRVVIVAAPQRSRGCADVGGTRIVLAIAPPSHFTVRRFARLLEHESAHILGMDHRDMPRELLYSLGKTPAWAQGAVLRYRGRASDQIPRLSRRSKRYR